MSHTATMSNNIRQQIGKVVYRSGSSLISILCDNLLYFFSTVSQIHGNSRPDYPVSETILDIGLFRKRSMYTRLDPSFRSRLLINLVKSRRMKCKRDHNRDKSTTHTKFSSGNPKACDDLWDKHSQF
jgi:hypothetical protein